MKKVLLVLSIFLLIGCSKKISYKEELNLLAKHYHDNSSFTQGLFFHDGQMYETIRLYGKSKLIKNVNIESGEYDKEYKFEDDIFAEGATVFKDKIYVLTWKEKKIFVFNIDTLELERELEYDKEGWGLTTDGNFLIASDGTNNLYYLDEDANIVKTVTIDGVFYLNELEYINGEIWANVYMSDYIAIINPVNESLSRMLDMDGLYIKPDDVNSVLNGIAFNNNRVFLTGKNWDTLFEFALGGK